MSAQRDADDDYNASHPGLDDIDEQPDEMRPEDHIDDHGGPILMMGDLPKYGAVEGHFKGDLMLEPIEHGFALYFICGGCGQKWTAAIDFDEMEVSE